MQELYYIIRQLQNVIHINKYTTFQYLRDCYKGNGDSFYKGSHERDDS